MNVLFVCTAGLQRSPTAADVFMKMTEEKNKHAEVRYAGTNYAASVPVTKELVDWADRIYVMKNVHRDFIVAMNPESKEKIKVLDIEDIYKRNDPELVEILKKKLQKEI